MFLVYKHSQLGTYHSVEVSTREEADKYEPYVPFVTANDANVLCNHLNGHPLWSKSSCTVCRPAVRPKPPSSTMPTDYEVEMTKSKERLRDRIAGTAEKMRRKP